MDAAALQAALDAYAAAWSTLRADAIERHWDATEPAPLYVAEEIDAPMQGFEAIRAYWRHNEAFHRKVSLRFSQTQAQPLGESRVLSVSMMHWDIAFASGQSRAMGGSNRVAATWRATAGGPKLVAWIEAPLAPITYFRRLYEAAVTPGFDV